MWILVASSIPWRRSLHHLCDPVPCSGPPYQDIAFRIVNKEWEYSHKKGYRCTFERGILNLHFNFKRHRYRR
ncbi:unnamed protein product [Brassica oleracea]|uniref:(rape) hypothetical protein n=1 Tax=Brassica napus TaxID=3708 RepID=A0A816N8Q6_BRANA|nr:unnamed protein product [Brassica napus]